MLGPLLFLVYINDLLELRLRGSIFAFADDITVIHSLNRADFLAEKINFDLLEIARWYYGHHLVLNLTKSRVIAFSYKAESN